MIRDNNADTVPQGKVDGRPPARLPASCNGAGMAARPIRRPGPADGYWAFVYLSISARASSISAWPSTPLAFTSSTHFA
jgi:hypothetical protein